MGYLDLKSTVKAARKLLKKQEDVQKKTIYKPKKKVYFTDLLGDYRKKKPPSRFKKFVNREKFVEEQKKKYRKILKDR